MNGMSFLTAKTHRVTIKDVRINDDSLTVDLTDGRTISLPLAWYPRLIHATQRERTNWRFIGANEGIHWPDLDEDISIENLILGKPSGESQHSFEQWLKRRSGK
jgi:hypothetical protein